MSQIERSSLDDQALAFVQIFMTAAMEVFPGNEGFEKTLLAVKYIAQTMDNAKAEAIAEREAKNA